MSHDETPLTGPDFAQGVRFADLPDSSMLLGQFGGEAVMLVRRDQAVFALGAKCTHYGAPLSDGVVIGDQVRCPWHHTCFDVRNGAPVAPPALNPIDCYNVERRGDTVVVLGKRERTMVIVGAGAAGNAAAEMLRREGYGGRVVLIGAEENVPVDRPNLSKDYLAGNAPEEWIPLRDRAFYDEQKIELMLGARVTSIDAAKREVVLASNARVPYEALLLATGADPIRLDLPGADLPHVFTLRSLKDSRAIIAATSSAKRAVVIGASFIGLEVAASLVARKLEVHVVAPESRPLERVLGPELGDFIRALHEEHGVKFHLGRKPASISEREVVLDDGSKLAAELVVMGVGVRPALALAQTAGCRIDGGVVVDPFLETSVPGVFAAGDIARWPDPRFAKPIRVEHWVVAERQGQTAAKNMLGARIEHRAVPFFWSQHYDVQINYVGHAESWDRIDVRGNIAQKNCVVAYRKNGRVDAVASIWRDQDSLNAEAALERGDQAALEALLASVGT